MRRVVSASAAALVMILACAGTMVTATGTAGAASDTGGRVGRVLILSLPEVDWSDIVDARAAGVELAHLDRLFAESSIGGMVTNGVLRPSNLGASYVSLGAGARALAAQATSGQGFGVDEPFGRDSAGVVFSTRTGTPPGRGLVYMPVADVVEENEAELYGAEPGLFGDALAEAGVSRAVIANGDGTDPSTPEQRVPPFRRSAVAALMTGKGRVPGGQVDEELLRQDASAPFGVRLDERAVRDAFADAWVDRSVVLVEASDLVRATLAGRFASESQAERLVRQALRDTDRLLGALLESVDSRDAVIVVGPVPPNDEHGLTIAAVRAPGYEPGLLTSTTTNHDGFVSITDVAPTVLRMLGIVRPDAMEGRRMETGTTDGSPGSRVQSLVDVNEDGLFRDGKVGVAMTIVVVIASALAIGTVVIGRWWRRGRALVAFAALFMLGFLDATYLAGPFHFVRNGGAGAYWTFVVVVGLMLAGIFHFVGRRLGHPIDAALVGLGSVVALHVIDLVTGAHLEWNTVFGYSPTIGIRFVGQGNLTFAQLVAAAVLFAGLITWRVAAPWGIRIAIAVLGVTVVVMIAPFWGNDFGAILSAVPAFALLVWLLLGRKVTARTIVGLVGLGVGSVVVVGLLDLLRPADSRTHVGKFFVKLFDDADAATLVIRRKAAENLSVLGHSVLLGTIIVTALLVAYLWFAPPKSLRALPARIPTVPATIVAFLTVAALGFLLNDSGVTIPGMMFAVLESALVYVMAMVLTAESR